MKVVIGKKVLGANDRLASFNQVRLDEAGIFCVNILGSPGSGKTTLLEALFQHPGVSVNVGVIEGDLATSRDADRISARGIPCRQINTGGGCHLDAKMVAEAMNELSLKDLDWLFIENVGNLVCPANYKLGEHFRMIVLSTAEGDDKVAKYPLIFRTADLVIINKIDLLEYVEYDLSRVEDDLKKIASQVKLLKLSAKTGSGVKDLAEFLMNHKERL